MKKFVTDGLLQIALLLSILRTDLNLQNYLNLVDNHLTYPEIHDIILGSSSAYTQASNVHNNHWHDGVAGYANPKSIENYYANSVFSELHSLSHYRRFGNIRTNLESYLVTANEVSSPTTGDHASDNSDQAVSTGTVSTSGSSGDLLPPPGGGNGDDNNNLQQHPSSPEGAAGPAETESQPFNFLQHPSGELSKEDMNLIDVLWRQDMDLGAEREAYDVTRRRQLEKDGQVEQKWKQQLENEESETPFGQTALPPAEEEDATNSVLDTETGEWVPAPMTGTGQSLPPQLDDNDGLSEEDALHFIETQLHQPSVGEEDTYITPQTTFSPVSPLEQVVPLAQGDGAEPLAVDLHLDEGLVWPQPQEEAELQAMFSVAEQMQADLQQQQQQFTEEPNSFPSQSVAPAPQPQRNEPSDIEQSWQEIQQSLFDVSATNSSAPVPDVPHSVPAAPDLMDIGNLSDSDLGPLIQNATLLPPQGDQSFNITEQFEISPMLPDPQFLMQNNDTLMITPPMEANPLQSDLNNTAPNQMGAGMLLPFEPDFDFTNFTSPIKQEDDAAFGGGAQQIAASGGAGGGGGGVLRQLMDADQPVESMDLNETALVEGLNQARMDEMSDSALSSMSGSPPHNDLNETGSVLSNLSSPGGATGGSDYESAGSDDMSPFQSSLDGGAFFRFGATSNGGGDRRGRSPSSTATRQSARRPRSSSFSRGSSDGVNGFDWVDRTDPPGLPFDAFRHVNHNHTYPAAPGEAPKERKADIKKKEKLAAARYKDMTKDERRAHDMRLPFTTEEIINSPVEEFNDMIERHKLTEPQKQLIRDIRRRGKNKVAAQNCRKRKIDNIDDLSKEVTGLRQQRKRLMSETEKNKEALEYMHRQVDDLIRATIASQRDENGDAYDPTQVNLDQTSDGTWVFVPRNDTNNNERTDRNGRKRKGGPNKKEK